MYQCSQEKISLLRGKFHATFSRLYIYMYKKFYQLQIAFAQSSPDTLKTVNSQVGYQHLVFIIEISI